ncbi:MAG: hypothetical protein B7Z62_03145, partial [Deltaproteobacteria bacterium 37-65-8]
MRLLRRAEGAGGRPVPAAAGGRRARGPGGTGRRQGDRPDRDPRGAVRNRPRRPGRARGTRRGASPGDLRVPVP